MGHPASTGILLNHARDKIVLLDERGNVTYANDATERILGWTPNELVGQNAFQYIHPDDVDEARETFERTIAADVATEATVEIRYRTKDGSWVWLESRMSNVTDHQLDGYVVSSRDITDRVEAQHERQEISERLEELSATTGDVLWVFNADWSELLFVNPAYEDVYGGSVEELEEHPDTFFATIHPDDILAVRDAMDCLSAGTPADLEYRVNPGKDYNVWVWAQAEPIVKDGEVVRIIGFTRDVTDRYRRERQLYVMDNLLRHNLRNDMNVILGNAELIEDETPETANRTAVIRQTGEELLASAEKGRDIIEVLTERASLTQVDICSAVSEAVETVRGRYPTADIDVSFAGEATGLVLDEIRLAIVELVENAVIHSKSEEPSVHVAVESVEDSVVVFVKDDAPPMPEIEARVLTGNHEMNDIYHSTGLGLWLSHWIVELSDGKVAIRSDPQGGNQVRLTLPRYRG